MISSWTNYDTKCGFWQTLKVKVVADGTTMIPMELPDDATVKDLKEVVHDMFTCFSVENQELLFNGLLLQDNTKLASYRLVSDSEITLRLLFTIVIIGKNPDGQYQRYEVRAHRNNFVGDLKLKLSEDHGLDITNIRLQMGPESYLLDRTLLWANRISSGTRIYVAEE